MRLSLNVSGIGPLPGWLKLAAASEQAGLDGVWFSEHAGFHDAVVPAAITAARTERIEVGVMGATPTTRHPVILAMELATLTEVFPDRIRVQVGTGDALLMAPLGGIPKSPLGAVESLVASQRALLSGESFTGQVGGLESTKAALYTGPRIVPIDVLAIRPKMLELALTVGDGVALSSGASLAYLAGVVEQARKANAKDEKRAEAFRVTAAVIASVSDDLKEATDKARSMLSAWSPEILAILAPDIDVASLGSVRDWPDELLNEVAFIATPATLQARLEAYAETGVDELAMGFVNPPENLDGWLRDIVRTRDFVN